MARYTDEKMYEAKISILEDDGAWVSFVGYEECDLCLISWNDIKPREHDTSDSAEIMWDTASFEYDSDEIYAEKNDNFEQAEYELEIVLQQKETAIEEKKVADAKIQE